jgi:hypothetical protein
MAHRSADECRELAADVVAAFGDDRLRALAA